MLAQAYMKVGEVFPALRSAWTATELAPLWWPAFQTLGRTQLGIGEVSIAIKTFSKAIHLSPEQKELWTEDLQWAVTLRDKQKELTEEELERIERNKRENSLILEEIKCEDDLNPLSILDRESADTVENISKFSSHHLQESGTSKDTPEGKQNIKGGNLGESSGTSIGVPSEMIRYRR